MYKIFADDTLIYDSTIEDYKIGKGIGSLETNKAGSFTFSVYPEHFFYDRFVKKKTVIVVTKSDRILFRGRVLDDQDDMWKRREIICEGELNFLLDSQIKPYTFKGTPEEAFIKYVTEHNDRVDEFKRFKIGSVTVHDPNNSITRSNSNYESALKNLTSRLLEDSLGGYLHITHGDDGKDPVPTLHYLADLEEISSQPIEFGSNLKDYLRKGTGQAIATAIIPLGVRLDDGNVDTDDPRLTIASVNNGVDYVYDEAAVAKHGWIFDTVIFDDVTLASNLKTKGLEELAKRIRENITVELTAVDLHLLDRSIDSFRHDTYVRVVSPPHNFAETLLCHRQTFNMLRPDNDTVTLGTSYSTFTKVVATTATSANMVKDVQKDVNNTANAVSSIRKDVNDTATTVAGIRKDISDLNDKTAAQKIAEQRMSSLMAQSFGIFRTEEVLVDGSTVHYLHDKPKLTESVNIWKMTGDVFAVSSDGGRTWNAGLDATGNAILNTLSVIGIDASWINADNLAAISANLGGWTITKDGIYREIRDADDPSLVFQIYIRAPDEDFVEGASILNLIDILRSKDGGNSFEHTFSVQGQGTVEIAQTDAWASLGGGAMSLGVNNMGHTSYSWNGIDIYKGSWNEGTISSLAYLSRRNTTDDIVDMRVNGVIMADEGVRDYSAYSGDIQLGGIIFQFRYGILTAAWSVG